MHTVSRYLAAGWITLVGRALAVHFINLDYDISIDQPFTIEWTEAAGPVTITLMKNATDQSSLQTVDVIDCNTRYSPISPY